MSNYRLLPIYFLSPIVPSWDALFSWFPYSPTSELQVPQPLSDTKAMTRNFKPAKPELPSQRPDNSGFAVLKFRVIAFVSDRG